MRTMILLCLAASLSVSASEFDTIYKERNGLLIAEAEAFVSQHNDDVRKWHVVSSESQPSVEPDGDPPHYQSASGKAYLEILPDTRRTHDDKLIQGENFINTPGAMAILTYLVQIQTPGRYYVWVSAYSTGTEDNGIHVGLNGEWPASGARMQWCEGKNGWRWESKQRTREVHCGEPYKIYLDIEEPGVHEIHFSMREDGFEFDQWLLTLDREFNPREE